MKITIIDPIVCQTDSPKVLEEFLTVKKTFWKKGQYAKERNEYESPLVDRKGIFLTGFLPRVIRACQTRGILIALEGSLPKLEYDPSLEYPSIKLFPDQRELIEKTLQKQRGIIQSPTGTGKTVLCYAILHSIKSKKSLIICPSQSIMTQTAEEFRTKFGMKTSVFGGGIKDLSGDVVVGLINSLNKIPTEDYCDLFDIIITDECFHKQTKISTEYEEKSISKIQVGEVVLSNKDGIPVKNRVTKVFKNRVAISQVAKITLSNSKTIFCSKDHLFSTKEGWLPAHSLANKELKGKEKREHEKSKFLQKLPNLWDRIHASSEEFQPKVLFKTMLYTKPRDERVIFKNDGKNKSEVCICSDEKKCFHS